MTPKIKRIIRKYIRIIAGKASHLKKTIKCESMWLGNDYGGFYIFPAIINNDSIVYSIGIGEDISFDKSIINKFDCKVYGFDPTPKSIEWVKSQNTPKNFSFHSYGLGSKTEKVNFFLPKNPNFVSGSQIGHNNVSNSESIIVQMKSLADIVTELKHVRIDILKIDIEGSEYNVIEGILDLDLEINQILIEFHERFFPDGKSKSIKTINSLKKHGYEIFAVSDSFEEVSFIKKNLLNYI